MSYNEKTSPEVEASGSPQPESIDQQEYVDRPSGWMYKGKRVFGSELWYASPKVQLFMVAIVCFLCPGMFNALGGMGGAGLSTPYQQDQSNTALYSTFAFTAFFSGTIANRIGLRLTLSIGGIGYCIYAASFLCYKHTANVPFVLFAGALLGVCAGLLWCGQGMIMMSYPPEEKKGRYISWFWIIFNFGAVIGALIPLGQNINNSSGTVTDGTYAAFIVLMFTGGVLALFLVNADKVIREDNTKVILMKNPSWKSEFLGLWETLITEPWIILLFPMFFCSNIFYTYQQNDMNGAYFNTRTRALNNLLYWLAQIVAAVIWGYALDITVVSRHIKARIALGVLFALTMIIWGSGYAYMKDLPGRDITGLASYDAYRMDWNSSGYIGPMFLYFFYGFFDACWQTSIYWFLGSMSNSGRKTANYAGFYKGIQSAGGAVFWSLDNDMLPYKTIFGVSWGLLAGSLVLAAPVIFMKIKDHVTLEEDLKFSDETVEDIVVGTKRIDEV